MSLRVTALCAAIFQALSATGGFIECIRASPPMNEMYTYLYIAGVLAEVSLAIFLFHLVAKQKKNI